MPTSIVKLAKTSTIDVLETWLPPRNSTMRLCDERTGPFVTIEEYTKLETAIELLIAGGFVSRSRVNKARNIVERAAPEPDLSRREVKALAKLAARRKRR